MTATQIIGEIVALPAAERAEVIRFARSLEAEGMLGAAADANGLSHSLPPVTLHIGRWTEPLNLGCL